MLISYDSYDLMFDAFEMLFVFVRGRAGPPALPPSVPLIHPLASHVA